MTANARVEAADTFGAEFPAQRSESGQRRRSTRMDADVPVLLTIMGSGGETLGFGRAAIANISRTGVGLARIHIQGGRLPLEPHFIVIMPTAPFPARLWFRLRTVYVHFSRDGAMVGAAIVGASRGYERIFDEIPVLQ